MRPFRCLLPVLALLGVAFEARAQTCQLLADINPSGSSRPLVLIDCFGEFLLFWANDGTHGYEPWRTDGTAAGTMLVKDTVPGAPGGSPNPDEVVCAWTAEGARAFYVNHDGTNGRELWTTDGTAGGTFMVKDIRPGPLDGASGPLVTSNGRVFFGGFDAEAGWEPWTSDGTGAGTFRLADVDPGTGGGGLPTPAAFRGRVLFAGKEAFHNPNLVFEPWITDGTVAGTSRLKDIEPGPAGSGPRGFRVRVEDEIVFWCNTPSPGGLWKTDGTQAGTVLVKGGFTATGLTPGGCNGKAYFAGSDATHGRELWISDGTTSGTVFLKDINVGTRHSDPQHFLCCDGQVFFFANDGSGNRLWVTDGTAAGTNTVSPPSALMGPVVAVGRRVYFSVSTGGSALTLWTSDGTTIGTMQVCGVSSSAPRELAVFHGDLYFQASDSNGDVELHVLSLPGASRQLLGEGSRSTFCVLDATSPLLGGVSTHTWIDGPSGHVGLLLLDAQRAPFTVPGVFVPGACAVVDNLSAAAIPLGMVQPPSGSFALRIPDVPAFAGIEVHTQIWWADAQSALPLKTSNGVQLSIGG